MAQAFHCHAAGTSWAYVRSDIRWPVSPRDEPLVWLHGAAGVLDTCRRRLRKYDDAKGEIPGVLAYGASEAEARAKVQALALRVVADRLEHGETSPDLLEVTFNPA